MPKMYNPDTQETVDVSGREVRDRKTAGFVTVGNRPESEFMGKTREELTDDDDDAGDAGDTGEAGDTGDTGDDTETEETPA